MPPKNLMPLDRYRDFDADAEEIPDVGPSFRLGGEEFRCVPLPAGGTLTRLAAAISRDERGRQVYNLPDMNVFIEDCLIEELTVEIPADDPDNPDAEPQVVIEAADDVERWRALMADKKRPIPVKTIADVVIYLSELYNDRPTRPSRR